MIKFYKIIVSVLPIVLLYTNVVLYLNLKKEISLTPKYVVIMVAVLTIPLLLLRTQKIKINNLFFKGLVFSLLLYIFSFLLTYITKGSLYGVYLFEGFTYILFPIALIFYYLIYLDKNCYNYAIVALKICIILAPALVVYDFLTFNPSQFSNVVGRGAGFYINPNRAAFAMIFGLITVFNHIPEKYKSLLITWIGVGIAFTLSRGAILCYLIYLTILIYQKAFRPKIFSLKALSLVLVIGVAGFFSSSYFANSIQKINRLTTNFQKRITQLYAPSSDIITEDTRFEDMLFAANKFATSPIYGLGLGSDAYYGSQRISTMESHNSYLHFAMEFGVIGLLYIGIFIWSFIIKSGRIQIRPQLGFLVIFCLTGMFSHSMLGSQVYGLCYCLIYLSDKE